MVRDFTEVLEESRTETLSENNLGDRTTPESDIETNSEEMLQWELACMRVIIKNQLLGSIRIEVVSPLTASHTVLGTLPVASKVFDEGINGDKQGLHSISIGVSPTTQTKEVQNSLQKMARMLKRFKHYRDENEHFGTRSLGSNWATKDPFLQNNLQKIAIYEAKMGMEWLSEIRMFGPPLVQVEVDYKDGFIPGLLKYVLFLSYQFDVSSIETWEQNEEVYNDLMTEMKIRAIFNENIGEKRPKSLPDGIVDQQGNFLGPSATLNLFFSAHHTSEGRFGDVESKMHQTVNLLLCHRYPMVKGSNVVMGRITELAPKDLMAPSPGNESPGGGGGTASGGFRADLEDGTSRQRAPPDQARRSYSQRLETFYDVEFYFSNPSPSAHDLSSAGLYLDGIHLICDGCDKRHARSLLVNKDPRSNQFHLMSCVYRRPRPMCQVCLQSPIASLPSEVGRCVQCHHDRQIRAFSDVLQTPEYVPPPVHNSRAFVTQQCVVPECRRQIRTRREQDVCCRCWGVVCDLCVTQRRYHDHP